MSRTREEDRIYQAKRRAERKLREGQMGKLSLVAPLPPETVHVTPPAAPRVNLGPVGADVRREMEAMPGAIDKHPGLAAMALALAAIVDAGNVDRMAQAVKEIKLLLADMRPADVAADAAPTVQEAFFARLGSALPAQIRHAPHA